MSRSIFSASLVALTLCACQSQPKASEPAAAPDKAKAPGTTAAAPIPAAAAAQPYTLRIVPGPATAGQASTSVVEVTPAAGFHINKDFPARLKLSPPAGVTAPKAELGKEDAELTDELLRFSVGFTAANTGKVTMSGTTDFSVCNDSTCKLIRDEKLAWDVEVK